MGDARGRLDEGSNPGRRTRDRRLDGSTARRDKQRRCRPSGVGRLVLRTAAIVNAAAQRRLDPRQFHVPRPDRWTLCCIERRSRGGTPPIFRFSSARAEIVVCHRFANRGVMARHKSRPEVSGFSRGGTRRAGGYAGGIFEGFAQIQPKPAKTPGPKYLPLCSFQNPETSGQDLTPRP
jgi:hypothetical protein